MMSVFHSLKSSLGFLQLKVNSLQFSKVQPNTKKNSKNIGKVYVVFTMR
jgi:hypothetical protein